MKSSLTTISSYAKVISTMNINLFMLFYWLFFGTIMLGIWVVNKLKKLSK